MTIFPKNESSLDRPAPAVSVIIPAYNVARFIQETLDSVFAQSFTDFEVIVINDGSPDTFELESEIAKYGNSIIYIKQSNQGAGAARNAGLRIAGGKYVAFLDGDDIWLPEFLAEQIKLIQTADGYDLVYANAINFGDGDFGDCTFMDTNPSHGKVTFEKLLCGDCNIITSTVLARRDFVVRVGGFDESFVNSQDFDLWLRLAKDANAKMTYQQKVLIRRRIYEGSLASDPVKSFEGELSVLNKVRRRRDLTSAESAVLEHVIPLRSATADLIRGKRFLVNGDYDAARSAFASAQLYFRNWKLRFVLAGIRLTPQFVRNLYNARWHH